MCISVPDSAVRAHNHRGLSEHQLPGAAGDPRLPGAVPRLRSHQPVQAVSQPGAHPWPRPTHRLCPHHIRHAPSARGKNHIVTPFKMLKGKSSII